jgi:hypothetical protein
MPLKIGYTTAQPCKEKDPNQRFRYPGCPEPPQRAAGDLLLHLPGDHQMKPVVLVQLGLMAFPKGFPVIRFHNGIILVLF